MSSSYVSAPIKSVALMTWKEEIGLICVTRYLGEVKLIGSWPKEV